MKKLCLLSILLIIIIVPTVKAEGIFGLDFSVGAELGFQNFSLSQDTTLYPLTRQDFSPNIKIATYDYFLFNNMFGIHASMNFSLLGFLWGEKINGVISPNVLNINESIATIEFFIGPAFGIDIGDSDMRFQTGFCFHYIGFLTTTEFINQQGNNPEKLNAFGLGITPQLRFGKDDGAVFILGTDITLDFAANTSRKSYPTSGSGTHTPSVASFTRFAFNPYLGIGLNF